MVLTSHGSSGPWLFYDSMSATEHQARAVVLETLRSAGIQFYDLALAQARVSATHQSVAEADELLRISSLRARTGTGRKRSG